MPSEKEHTNPELNLHLDDLPIGRALGLLWDGNLDTVQFKMIATSEPPPTTVYKLSIRQISSCFPG